MKGFLIFFTALSVASAAIIRAPPVCPEPNPDGNAILFPNPDDCTTFYTCEGNNPILGTCDSGLWFNPEHLVCDYPENIPAEVCPSLETTLYPTTDDFTTKPATDYTTEPETDYTTEFGSTPIRTTTTPPFWPVCFSSTDIIANPYNCAQFYICDDNLKPILMECVLGLWFNPVTKVCDYPWLMPDLDCVPPPS